MNETFLTPVDLKKRLERILPSQQFLKMEGLGMEVPFFICPFKPKDYNDVQNVIGQIINILKNRGVNVLELNLYHIVIDILKQQEILEPLFELEPQTSKSAFLEQLQSSLDYEEFLIPYIRELLESSPPFDLIFLTGLGETFPYLRTHTLLNNLHSVICNKPLVAFYPGDYTYSESDGQSMRLFNVLSNDKYYRAFNILFYDIQDETDATEN